MNHIIESLNHEIERLNHARAILLNGRLPANGKRRRMSPETKQKIGLAMKKNWAKRRR